MLDWVGFIWVKFPTVWSKIDWLGLGLGSVYMVFFLDYFTNNYSGTPITQTLIN